MAGKAQRLGKAAGELNVGVSTIVEFLNSKGVSIDMNPNSKLEPEQYEMLRTQFAADQNLKEQSKLSAVKREKRETITLRDVKTEDTVAEDDDDFDANVLERVKTQPVTAPKPVAETPAPEAKEIVPETPKAAEPEVAAPAPAKAEKEEKPTPNPDAPKEIETIRVETRKLSGPTVLGKIELPVERPKSVGSSRPGDDRKKRKRIKKELPAKT